MSVRLEKVASLIKEEISLIFLYKLQDPVFSVITITEVKLTPDLKMAKVYVSIFDASKRKIVMVKLESLKKMIRTELAKKINIKFTPELSFYLDDTLDYVEKMENIFSKIKGNDNQSES